MKNPLSSLSLALLMTGSAHGMIAPSLPPEAPRPATAVSKPLISVTPTSVVIDPQAMAIDGSFDVTTRTLRFRFQFFSKRDERNHTCAEVQSLDETIRDPVKGPELIKRLEEGVREEFGNLLATDTISVAMSGPLDRDQTLSRIREEVAVRYTQVKIDALREGALRCQ